MSCLYLEAACIVNSKKNSCCSFHRILITLRRRILWNTLSQNVFFLLSYFFLYKAADLLPMFYMLPIAKRMEDYGVQLDQPEENMKLFTKMSIHKNRSFQFFGNAGLRRYDAVLHEAPYTGDDVNYFRVSGPCWVINTDSLFCHRFKTLP